MTVNEKYILCCRTKWYCGFHPQWYYIHLLTARRSCHSASDKYRCEAISPAVGKYNWKPPCSLEQGGQPVEKFRIFPDFFKGCNPQRLMHLRLWRRHYSLLYPKFVPLRKLSGKFRPLPYLPVCFIRPRRRKRANQMRTAASLSLQENRWRLQKKKQPLGCFFFCHSCPKKN